MVLTNMLQDNIITKRILNRGPNGTQKISIKINKDITAIFNGSVLWMQGSVLTLQPIETDHGVLLFNGDIFDDTWRKDTCDTMIIMEKLALVNKV